MAWEHTETVLCVEVKREHIKGLALTTWFTTAVVCFQQSIAFLLFFRILATLLLEVKFLQSSGDLLKSG